MPRVTFSLSFLIRDRHVWPATLQEPGAPASDTRPLTMPPPADIVKMAIQWPGAYPKLMEIDQVGKRGERCRGCSRFPFCSGIFADFGWLFPPCSLSPAVLKSLCKNSHSVVGFLHHTQWRCMGFFSPYHPLGSWQCRLVSEAAMEAGGLVDCWLQAVDTA